MSSLQPKRISIAPMMDYTDRHFRRFMRILSKNTILYTEMIIADAIIHGDRDKLLGFDPAEQPLVIQLGGSDPERLAKAATIAEGWGYQEVNLNVGCPSSRVQSGRFGACLMNEPRLVADCVEAMRSATNLPVTVKTRIGVDDNDSYEALCAFIEIVQKAGCDTFIVHARKAWLKGLSPKENREIPPLIYPVVYQLKQDYPSLTVVLNGGVNTLSEIESHLPRVDGVMLGRAAYKHPYLFAEIDRAYFGEISEPISEQAAVMEYLLYAEEQAALGVRNTTLIKPLIGLFQGRVGARAWRRHLSTKARQTGSIRSLLLEGLALIQ